MNRYNYEPLLYNAFFKVIEAWPDAQSCLKSLSQEGELLLFGGAVRDFCENGYSLLPRDFDIVVNTKLTDLGHCFPDLHYEKNRYGGYKLDFGTISFDIWALSSTWAFRERIVQDISADNLVNTVFFNLDAIVYDFNSRTIYDGGYSKAREDGFLDIVLEQNPHPELCVLRAFVLKKKYNVFFANRLRKYINTWINNFEILDDVTKTLQDVQETHYGKNVLSKYEIYNELKEICFT
jgi:hypothetical protein